MRLELPIDWYRRLKLKAAINGKGGARTEVMNAIKKWIADVKMPENK